MWVRFTILWADLVRHSPGSDRSSLEWGGLAGSGELDRLPTIDHRREAIDRRCRLNVIFGNGLRKLGVEEKIIPGGAGTFYSGQEKRDRCNVSEAGSQRGRKSFVATPEQRNNVKILVGLTLCLAWRLTPLGQRRRIRAAVRPPRQPRRKVGQAPPSTGGARPRRTPGTAKSVTILVASG